MDRYDWFIAGMMLLGWALLSAWLMGWIGPP
jgi:hypothetical protein